MSDNTKNMSIEDAEKIVAAGNRMAPDFDEALRFLTEHAPNSNVLRNYHEDINNRVKKVFDEMAGNIEHDKNEREILGQANSDLTDDKEISANIRDIDAIMEDEQFNRYLSLATNRDAGNVNVDSNGTILGEREGKDAATIAQEASLRKKYINEAMEAAKKEVLMFYAQDKKFAAYDIDQKRRILQDGITDLFNFKMAKIVMASAVKNATDEQTVPGSDAYKKYEEQSLADMRAALEAYYSKKTVTVKTQHICGSTVVTSEAMDEYEAGLKQKQLNDAAVAFNQKKEDYNAKRRSFWGKAFDMAKKVWHGMKQNKYRIITDAAVVAGAGLVATISAPATIVAATGMGLYFAAGSFGWLLNDERRKMAAKAQDKSEWKGFKGLTKAFNSMDGEAKKKFWRNGSIQAAAGVAGAALFGALGSSAAGIVSGRIANGVARSVGSVANQGVNWALASKEYKANATEENKTLNEEAKTGFIVSATVAVVANAISAYFGLSHNSADVNTDVNTGDVKADDVNAGDLKADDVKADDVNTDDVKADDVKADDVKADDAQVVTGPVKVPSEWNEGMSISKEHWVEMHNKITGIYKDHAAIFGKENVSPDEAMAEMYQNVQNARGSGYFANQTTEEVLYKYMKLIEHTERATKIRGIDYLVTKLDSKGEPMYWNNAEEMKALNRIILCNEKVQVSADRIGNTLALINNKGAYTGEGANIGVTNNRYVGGRYNCDEYQNAWAKGAFAQKHPHSNVPPKLDETTIDKVDEPAKIEETTIDKQKGTVAWQEHKYTTGDNRLDAGPGKHTGKIVKSGVVSEEFARAAMEKAQLSKG